jgi:hypothetical protein
MQAVQTDSLVKPCARLHLDYARLLQLDVAYLQCLEMTRCRHSYYPCLGSKLGRPRLPWLLFYRKPIFLFWLKGDRASWRLGESSWRRRFLRLLEVMMDFVSEISITITSQFWREKVTGKRETVETGATLGPESECS